jgi:hypothetical protein
MGAGASIPPGVSEELKDKTVALLKSCKNDTGSTRTEALNQLWDIARTNKVPLTHSALEFVPTMVWVLESCKHELQTIEKCTGALFSLSCEPACRVHLCQSEFRLVPAIMGIIRLNSAIQTKATDALMNCSIDPRTHAVLLHPEHGYLDFLMTEIRANPATTDLYNAFSCLTADLDAKLIPALVKCGLPQFIMAKWTTNGIDTNKWGAIPQHCLSILLRLSIYTPGADTIRNLNQSQYIYSLLNAKDVQGIKASFLAACVYGREEENAKRKSLLDTYPHVLPYITSIFAQILDFDVTTPQGTEVKNGGFRPATINLSDIAAALKNLSLSEKNKMIIVQNEPLLNHILTAIQVFIDNKPEFGGVVGTTFRLAGGGGGDTFSLELFLELLLQLSFYYDDDESMRESFSSFGTFILSSMLETIINLDSSRKVSFEASQFAKQLLSRFKPSKLQLTNATLITPSAPSLSSSSPSKPSENNNKSGVTRPSHIMLSYAQGCNKNHVIALGKKLRDLGYDVWRDKDGSSIVSGMTSRENIVETMADAIQYAHTVVICVSAQYKDSANCRAEAKYAHARSNQTKDSVKLIYVMMDEHYHTRSSPRQVDGWLGFMVGTGLWYPLWDANQVNLTASSLAAVIGNNAKLPAYESRTNGQRSETTSIPSPIAGDSSSSSCKEEEEEMIPPLKPTGPPDCQAAFACLEKKKAHRPHTLEGLMEDLELATADDLRVVGEEDWMLLCQSLKKPQQKTFLEALRMDSSAFFEALRSDSTELASLPFYEGDYSAAWDCLDVKRARCPRALQGALTDFGIEKAEDLRTLERERMDIIFIGSFLKIPQQKALCAALKF